MTVFRLLIASLAAAAASAAFGQQDAPTRVPETGIAILDCEPAPPAPEDSCLLRVPPLSSRGALRSRALGELRPSFEFVRPGDSGFPDGVEISATLLLIDVSPGPGGGRRSLFSAEKELLVEIARGLPPGDLVAVYGFNEGLSRLTDFTTSHQRVVDVVEALELSGANTRIATHTREAVNILDRREDVLLKNLVIISDGEEEGIGSVDEVVDLAVEAGVSISVLGTSWRAEDAVAERLDYLERFAEGSLGVEVRVPLTRPAEARAAVDRFVRGFAASQRNSGLIVPEGTPAEADIVVTIEEPAPGSPSDFVDREISARFVPASAPEPDPPAEPPEPPKILGMQPVVAYTLGGVLILAAAALLAFLALFRRGAGDEGEMALAEGFEGFEGAEPEPEPPTAATLPPPKAPPPVAWLIREDTGEKLPISGQRIAIGRSSSNAVALADESISRVHAELHRNRDGGFSLTDMQSLNGTWVNDEKLGGTRRVSGGDRIRFGNIRTRLVLP